MKNKQITLENVLLLILTGLIFITFGFASSENLNYKIMTIIILVASLVITYLKRNEIKLFSLTGISVSAYIVFCGISTLYANSGKFAITEYAKYLVGFATFLIVLSAGKSASNKIIKIIAGLIALTAFLTIDGISLGIIEPNLEVLFYGSDLVELATFKGARITTFFGNENVGGTFFGTGLFLALYLFIKATEKKEKVLYATYMMLMAYTFFLCASLGATLSVALAVLGFVLLAKKEEICKAFPVILTVAGLSGLSLVLTLNTYVYQKSSGSILPFLSLIVSSLVLVLLNEYVFTKLAVFLEKIYKNAVLVTGGIIVLCALLGVVAFTFTKPKELTKGETYIQALYPEVGENQINLELANDSDEVRVRVYSYTYADKIGGTQTLIGDFKGVNNETDDIFVDVPEEAIEIRVRVTSYMDENVTLNYMTFTNGDDVTNVRMPYVFMPENISSRLIGLTTNNSLLLRMEIIAGSIKLMQLSPIGGHGLGGYENASQMVANFHFETKYAHSHYTQALSDTGIVGLIAYLAIIFSGLYLLIKSRKTELSGYLLGAFLVIAVHGGIDFSMSIHYFIPVAYAVFGLICINFDKNVNEEYMDKFVIATVTSVGIFVLALAGNVYSRTIITSDTLTIADIERAMIFDIYEKNDYILSYVMSTKNATNSEIIVKRDLYIKELEQVKSNAISYYLFAYYIEQENFEKAYEHAVKYMDQAPHDNENWDNVFNIYNKTLFTSTLMSQSDEVKQEFYQNILDLYEKYHKINATSYVPIVLNDVSIGFENAIKSLIK